MKITFEKLIIWCFLLLALGCAQSPVENNLEEDEKTSLSDLILNKSDSVFGGYYLDIQKVMERYQISRLEAHEVQNQFRDQMESDSGSYSRLLQGPYVYSALGNAITNVVEKKNYQHQFTPMTFKKNEFVVVFDLDETLLSHWYKKGVGVGKERLGSLFPTRRDEVPSTVDRKTGNSIRKAKMLLSPDAVQLRPGIKNLISSLSAMRGFKGFVFFTAKEDRSALALLQIWRQTDPRLFKHFKGIFARNHLFISENVDKPSKDLRIIDPSLKHIVLIDDNESRVLQKELNFRIPKFNADQYLEAKERENKRQMAIHGNVLAYLSVELDKCSRSQSFSNCIRTNLGEVSKNKGQEIKNYLLWLRSKGWAEASYEAVEKEHNFHPPFLWAFERELYEPFPNFQNFKLLL